MSFVSDGGGLFVIPFIPPWSGFALDLCLGVLGGGTIMGAVLWFRLVGRLRRQRCLECGYPVVIDGDP